MTDAQGGDAFRQLVQRIEPGARPLRTWPLAGGVSAQVTALELERPDGRRTKLIVRQHGEVDRSRNAQVARDEFTLLQVAAAHGLAAPRPCSVDESCDLFPTPVLVVEYAEGETVFAPADLPGYVARAAAELARIHSVTATADLSFLPELGKGVGERPAVLDDSLDEGRIRDALEAAWPLPRTNRSVLLHGDYWPGNILWRDGEIAAVIDWEDAAIGEPLADLANGRLEFLWAFGAEAMNGLTAEYRSRSEIDFANLPYWDLCAALRPCSKLAGWGLDEATERRMRERQRHFVDQAIAALGRR